MTVTYFRVASLIFGRIWRTMWLQLSRCRLFEKFCSRPHFQTSSWTIPNATPHFSGSGSDLHYLDHFKNLLLIEWLIDLVHYSEYPAQAPRRYTNATGHPPWSSVLTSYWLICHHTGFKEVRPFIYLSKMNHFNNFWYTESWRNLTCVVLNLLTTHEKN